MQIYEHIQHPCTTLHLTGRAPRPPKVDDGRVGLIAEAKAAAAAGLGPAASTDAVTGAAGA
jgi:hypothetical protein